MRPKTSSPNGANPIAFPWTIGGVPLPEDSRAPERSWDRVRPLFSGVLWPRKAVRSLQERRPSLLRPWNRKVQGAPRFQIHEWPPGNGQEKRKRFQDCSARERSWVATGRRIRAAEELHSGGQLQATRRQRSCSQWRPVAAIERRPGSEVELPELLRAPAAWPPDYTALQNRRDFLQCRAGRATLAATGGPPPAAPECPAAAPAATDAPFRPSCGCRPRRAAAGGRDWQGSLRCCRTRTAWKRPCPSAETPDRRNRKQLASSNPSAE